MCARHWTSCAATAPCRWPGRHGLAVFKSRATLAFVIKLWIHFIEVADKPSMDGTGRCGRTTAVRLEAGCCVTLSRSPISAQTVFLGTADRKQSGDSARCEVKTVDVNLA